MEAPGGARQRSVRLHAAMAELLRDEAAGCSRSELVDRLLAIKFRETL